MSSDRKGPIAALVAALVLVLVSALPAAAATASPVDVIVAALRHSPVYIDPAYTGSVPPADQRRLAAQIKATGLPIKVVLIPLVKGDSFNGDSATLAGLVHSRLGGGDMIAITTDSYGDLLDGTEWPYGKHQAQQAVSAVGFLDSTKNAGLSVRLAKAIALIKQGDGDAVYDKATARFDTPTPAPGPVKGGGGSAAGVVVALVVAVLVLAGLGRLLLVRRRRGGGTAAEPFAFPQAVFAAGRAADEDELRQRAEAEVLSLGEAVQAADPATVPGLQRALDAYTAAGTVLDGSRGMPDLAGVLALVSSGRDALAGHLDALPLCFFDPLHGRADRRVTWRPLGRRDQLDVAACASCATAVRDHRAPEVLTGTAADGRRVPYFELPPDSSVWAATGYGSLVDADGPQSMAGRIARGDFSQHHRRRI
ncbi:hypothetical protein [Streptantibioticus silvisoli]|uniref:TPM domain-containing protein n=1 Tax=Streptantibioticus silvisoli TaxID=2705255 RepID=A0ABT6VTY9_9ACTN|nr:hypothetical protein [Streptantibioticus silvisoli]MDI5961217.1 hypothetical protein [Streptantibioticus silvisoli]